MTLTLNEDCTEVLIASDYQSGDNQTVTLTVTANCGTAYTDIDIDVNEVDYTLLPGALVDAAESFVTGVYTIQLVTVQQDGSTVTELKCLLIDCVLNCTMLETFLDLEGNDENMIKALSYHALTAIADCDTCSCSDWCTLYNTATDQACVEDAQPCGCS